MDVGVCVPAFWREHWYWSAWDDWKPYCESKNIWEIYSRL